MAVKQNNRWIVITFVVNFCITLTTLYLVGVMFWVGLYRINPAGQLSAQQCGTDQNLAYQPALNAGGSPAQKIVNAAVNDSGFSPKEIIYNSAKNSPASVTVKNTGTKPHSFVIAEINLNSGNIAPGETKDIKLAGFMFAASKTYPFYSDAPGDDAGDFGGLLTVE